MTNRFFCAHFFRKAGLARSARSRALGLALGGAALLALAGCSSFDKPKPPELPELTQPVTVNTVWQRTLSAPVSFPLRIDARSGQFTVASDDGVVAGLDRESGEERWRVEVGAPLSAGVGSDGRYFAVFTLEGDLVLMEAGRELWRKRLDVRVFTAPLVAGERVFVLATDRSLHAFDAAEGRALWRNKPAGEPLTLSHPSVLGVQGNVLLAGNGRKLQGLDPDTGKVIWDTALANPRGTNEVERLADLVGPVARVGHVHCARAFQSALACLDGRKGVMLWSRSQSGFSALAADEKAVISVDASSRLVAWKLATGEELWLHDQLLHRELSSPLLWKHRLILGDGNGWVHWLDRDTGKTRARLELGMVPIQVQPVALDGTVLVVDAVGQVSALSE